LGESQYIEGQTDTIYALTTGATPSGVAVVRLSGDKSWQIARTLSKNLPENIESHRAYFTSICDPQNEEILDEGLLLFFANGKSYTGEQTCEFQVHGSAVVVRDLCSALNSQGARSALRGEFTFRAFVNGRIDLTQAEAVLELIHSESSKEARASLNNLRGILSKNITEIEAELVRILAHVEVGIDFTEERLDHSVESDFLSQIEELSKQIGTILSNYRQSKLVKTGLRVGLFGAPNAGKSSLFNQILGRERSIVSKDAGTTRDYVEAEMLFRGIKLRLIDTAGLHETSDLVEAQGVQRAQDLKKDVDLKVLVFDASLFLNGSSSSRSQINLDCMQHENESLQLSDWVTSQFTQLASDEIVVVHKSDLLSQQERIKILGIFKAMSGERELLFVSSLSGEGVKSLSELIAKSGNVSLDETDFMIQSRHADALMQAKRALLEAKTSLDEGLGPECAALDLRIALDQIQRILGKTFNDDILNHVFSEFCIGK